MKLDNDPVSIISRKPWSGRHTIYIIGPGGVGKSTLGKILSPLLKLRLIDLDEKFCDRIANVGEYISANGYERYREQNRSLARKLSSEETPPTLSIMSSGFLAGDSMDNIYRDNHTLVEGGYAIVLLPSADIDEATKTVVDRQMNRGFNLDRCREEQKFRERFERYRELGDVLVVSSASPTIIADAVRSALISARSVFHI